MSFKGMNTLASCSSQPKSAALSIMSGLPRALFLGHTGSKDQLIVAYYSINLRLLSISRLIESINHSDYSTNNQPPLVDLVD